MLPPPRFQWQAEALWQRLGVMDAARVPELDVAALQGLRPASIFSKA